MVQKIRVAGAQQNCRSLGSLEVLLSMNPISRTLGLSGWEKPTNLLKIDHFSEGLT
jgi:hypothetical protein